MRSFRREGGRVTTVSLPHSEIRGRIESGVADELWSTLMRFHREVAAPEIIGPLREEIAARHRETQANFDAVWKRFDRLESEYHALKAAVARIEQQLSSGM